MRPLASVRRRGAPTDRQRIGRMSARTACCSCRHAHQGLSNDYTHNVIDHAEAYVDGNIHTNGCENFWSLLKRGIKGTYVSVEPFHLFRYLDEQTFRFNERTTTDAQRFSEVVRGIVGRRVMYQDLIGPLDASTPQ